MDSIPQNQTSVMSVASHNIGNEYLSTECLPGFCQEPLPEIQRRIEGLEKGIEAVKEVVTQNSRV